MCRYVSLGRHRRIGRMRVHSLGRRQCGLGRAAPAPTPELGDSGMTA